MTKNRDNPKDKQTKRRGRRQQTPFGRMLERLYHGAGLNQEEFAKRMTEEGCPLTRAQVNGLLYVKTPRIPRAFFTAIIPALGISEEQRDELIQRLLYAEFFEDYSTVE